MSIERRFFAAAFVAICIWLPWAAMPIIVSLAGKDWQFEHLGQWGDSFGALSSLFTALGFAGVFAAFFQQREQINLQRSQNKISERYQHVERFDSTYFELIRLLREVRGEVRYSFGWEYYNNSQEDDSTEASGHKAIRHAWREAKYYIRREPGDRTKHEIDEIYYEKIHKRYESGFGPYFRLIYTILARIHLDTVLSEEQKAEYGNLLRSQLSSYELGLIGLNGMCHVSRDFRFYLTEYRMFRHLPPRSSRYNILQPLYEEKAFEGRN